MGTQHFGKYVLFDKLGSGGMAEVYLSKQSGLKGFEKIVAIKRILSHLSQDPEFVSMFINEAKLAALLNHQNIVQIFDLGHVDNAYYIAMEYVMGKDLRTVMHQSKAMNQPFSVAEILLIMTKISAGLDYAHRKKDLNGQDLNIVHRDMSPQNVLVSYEGEIKVVDFGIAKAASQASQTRTGLLKGKLSYMSPEQAWGKPVDRRTDVFALGIILYEMLTGQKLFRGENEFDTLEKVREAKVEPLPTQLNLQVTPELEAIVLKALAREPETRYSSAADLQVALEDLMAQKGYGFSTVRLSQHLQTLFAPDVERDTYRFRSAAGGTEAQDQSTVVRRPPPREAREVTPSHPTRSFITPIPKRKKPVFRIAVLALFFLFLAAVWAATQNLPVIQKIQKRFPATKGPIERLARMPEEVAMLWTSTEPVGAQPGMIAAAPNPNPAVAASPEPVETAALPGRDPVAGQEPSSTERASPTPAATPSPPPPHRPLKGPDTEHRPMTPAEQSEIRRLFEEARIDYDKRRLDEMEQKLRRIIELNPRLPMAHHLLAMVYQERKEPQGALRLLEDASRNLPDSAILHYDLGFLYYEQGVVSLARQELKKALELNAEGPNAEKARHFIELMRQARRPARPPASGSITPEPAPAVEPSPSIEPAPSEEAAPPAGTAPPLERVAPIEPSVSTEETNP